LGKLAEAGAAPAGSGARVRLCRGADPGAAADTHGRQDVHLLPVLMAELLGKQTMQKTPMRRRGWGGIKADLTWFTVFFVAIEAALAVVIDWRLPKLYDEE